MPIVDAFGVWPYDRMAATALFSLVSARCERGSIVLSLNKDFAEWGDVLGKTCPPGINSPGGTAALGPVQSPAPRRMAGGTWCWKSRLSQPRAVAASATRCTATR